MVQTIDRVLPLPQEHIEKLRNTEQNPRFHAEGNVYNHLLFVLEQFEKHADEFDLNEADREVLYWAAILHDIGKPVVTQWRSGRLTAKGHERAGVPIARDILLNRPEISTAQRQRILDLVKLHHIPLKWGLRQASLSEYKQLATKIDLRILGIFSLFDIMGRVCINKPQTLELIGQFNEVIVPRIRYELGTFDVIQQRYQHAGYQKKNALWHALKYDDSRLLQKILNMGSPEDSRAKSTCIITIGPPYAGKTQYVKDHFSDFHHFDLEAYKGRKGHSDESEYTLDVNHFMSAFLRKQRNLVIDGNNLKQDTRRRMVDCARDYGVQVHYLFFEKTQAEVLAANAKATQPLKESQIQYAFNELDYPHPWEAHKLEIVSD